MKIADFAVTYNNFMFGVADWIIVFCAVIVCAALIMQINEKTLTIGISLIAISTALASSCFGYARAIDSNLSIIGICSIDRPAGRF